MQLKSPSWMLLVGLACVVAFAAGARQGSLVEKENVRRQNEITKLTPSPTPRVAFVETKDTECNVSFLLPDYIGSGSAGIPVKCNGEEELDTDALLKQGYVETPVYNAGYVYRYLWVQAPSNLQNLIEKTIQPITP